MTFAQLRLRYDNGPSLSGMFEIINLNSIKVHYPISIQASRAVLMFDVGFQQFFQYLPFSAQTGKGRGESFMAGQLVDRRQAGTWSMDGDSN